MAERELDAQTVSELIQKNKENILQKWEAVIRERLPEAEDTSIRVLRDSIPKFIDALTGDLNKDIKKEVSKTEDVAKEHGKDRKDNTDFSIDQVVYEYFVLREVIFDTIEKSGNIEKQVYRTIAHSIDLGIRRSAEEYAARSSAIEAKFKAEQELALKRLGKAVEVAKLGFFDWDIPSDLVYFNSQMQEDWGIPAGTSLDKVVELIHPDDREETMKRINEAIKTGSHYLKQYRVKRPDGKEIWILAQGQVTYDENNKPLKFMGTSLDITEEKNAHDILLESHKAVEEREKGIRVIANSLPQIVWTARTDGFLDWYNDQWYAYTGMKQGTSWNDSESPIHPDDIPVINRVWKESYESEKPYDLEFRVMRKSDHSYRWHVARAVPLRDAKGKVIKWIGTTTDIDSQKKLQYELREEREIRERFVTALTHDLRTPLTSIKLSASTLRKYQSENKNIENATNRIISGVIRAENMVRDLLDANLLKAGETFPLTIAETSLDEVLVRVMTDLKTLHGDRFHLDLENGIIGNWDGEALQRVIENLAGNAVKYGDNSPIEINVHRRSDGAEITVHNFGEPINPNDQRRIFEKYQRTLGASQSGQKGWGIGLTLVKGIVEAHHGTVSLTSSKASGTEFKVWIPLNINLR